MNSTISRQFFVNNSVKNYNFITPKKEFQQSSINITKPQSQNRLRRAASSHQGTIRLNPQKFLNREVFKNNLYTKTFKIAVEFLEQKTTQNNKLYLFDECESFSLLRKKITKQNCAEFLNVMNSVSHHFRNLHKEINRVGNQQSRLKKEVMLLKEAFEKVLKTFCKDIQQYQRKLMQLLFAQKSQISLKIGASSSSVLDATNQILSSRKSPESYHNNITHMKPATSSGHRPSPINEQQVLNPSINKLKTLTNKVNLLQFQNKKLMLTIQGLQRSNDQKQKRIESLESRINEMSEKIDKVKEMQQHYNYKIKKLKEELQVAHIVKEQNLGEKMKYILQQDTLQK